MTGVQQKERGAGVCKRRQLARIETAPSAQHQKPRSCRRHFPRPSCQPAARSADLLLPSRAARLDRSIPLLIAHATAASNGTASCSDRASRSFAAGCAPRHAWASAEQLDRRQTVDRRTRQDNRRRSLPTVFRETKPASQSHCHLHSYFLRLPAKQLLFNCCPKMPTYEADTCMQNTASITA